MSNQKKNKNQRIGSPTKQARTSTTPSNSKTRRRKRVVWWKQRKVQYWLAAALLLTLVAYLPAFFNGFVNWDDPYYLKDNKFVKTFDLGSIFTEPVAANYHPLTMLTLAIEYQLVRMKPFLYHFTNILLHLINTALVFYFIYLISNRKIEVAGIVALFFGIHPMHVESVAWISERKDVLYTLFYLAALIAYTKHIFHKKRLTSPKIKRKPQPTYKYLVYTALFFLLSLLSKAMAVTVPVIMVFLDIYLNRIRLSRNNNPTVLKQALIEKIPFFALSLAFGFMALNIQGEAGAMSDYDPYSISERIAFAAYGFLQYIVKLFVPINLSAYYPYPAGDVPTSYLFAPLAVIALFAAAIYRYSKSKIPLFGLLFYGVTVALVLQFISVGVAIVADRYTYLPYVGLLFILGMGFYKIHQQTDATGKMWQMIAKGVLGFYIVLCVATTFQRTMVWKNSKVLWDNVLEQFPDNAWIAYINRATYYFNVEKDFPKAIENYSAAIKIRPKRKSFYYNRGLAYEQINENQKALDDYSQAIAFDAQYQEAISARANLYKKVNPELAMQEFDNALELDDSDYKAYINRSNYLREQKEFDKALEDINKAVEICNCYEGYFNRGGLYMSINQPDKAIADFSKAIELQPNEVNAYMNRGNLYRDNGKRDLALQDYTKALSIKETFDTYNNRGLLYNQAGNTQKAMADYSKAIEMAPKEANAYTNRGNLYFAAGQWDMALADYNKSLEIDSNYANGYGNRGAVHFQKKNYDAALEDFAKALEINPDHKDALKNRAVTYLTLKDCEKAKPDLQHFLTLYPDNKQVAAWLENCE